MHSTQYNMYMRLSTRLALLVLSCRVAQSDTASHGSADDCPPGLHYIADIEPPPSAAADEDIASAGGLQRHGKKHMVRIPKIIHQTGRSRCVTAAFKEIIQRWHRAFPDYAYRFHDDAALYRLFERHSPAGLLRRAGTVLRCVQSMTMKSDVWRYAVLWHYGGIYADMDTAPLNGTVYARHGNNVFNSSSISAQDESVFSSGGNGEGLSQFFMISVPGHPVMRLAIESALQHVLDDKWPGGVNGAWYIARTSGPGALKRAFVEFMATNAAANITYNQSWYPPGIYKGLYGRTLRLEGKFKLVQREAIARKPKIEA